MSIRTDYAKNTNTTKNAKPMATYKTGKKENRVRFLADTIAMTTATAATGALTAYTYLEYMK